MTMDWNNLPLVPLTCILDHLSVKNALAATSTCRHWRRALLHYEGRRGPRGLTLKAKTYLEKNLFLARVFRKGTRKLHVHIDCTENQLNKFLTYVLPQFFDAKNLQEVVFVGPIYLKQQPDLHFDKLKRIITECLVFRRSNFIQKLAFLGCEMDAVNDDKDIFVHKQLELYSKPLSFACASSPADAVLSRCIVEMMPFSSLKHIIFEYELISTEALETLSQLSNLSLVTLNVIFKREMVLPSIDWRRVSSGFSKGLDLTVNVISGMFMPHTGFKVLEDSVFVEGMPLTSLKVLFCKILYVPLLHHVSLLYNKTLQELVWVDAPYDGLEPSRIVCTTPQLEIIEMHEMVNPFILLCWQCEKLRRLAIHGYWVWQYDMLGFVRLRQSLKLEISSLYANQDQFGLPSLDANMLRVMNYDSKPTVDTEFVKKVNEIATQTWRPKPWRRLHPALKSGSTREHLADYMVKEVLKPPYVT